MNEKPPRQLSEKEIADAQRDMLYSHIEYLEEQHGLDHLTGLKTRKIFEHELNDALKVIRGEVEEHRKNAEHADVVSLISIDIDHFKKVNDTLGHLGGDEVLKRVSALLLESVRDTDTVARMGGEEITVLMRGADVEVAARHAEELREKIEHLTFGEKYPNLKVTASFGVISSDFSNDEATLIEGVDEALYRAKEGGRNQVVVYPGS